MNDEGTLPSEFLQRVNDAISVVEKCDNVRIISHYDADGIASAGVVCGALLKRKKDFHVSMVRNLNAQAIVQILAKPNFDCLIISDMGSSFIEIFEKAKTPVIILDHHSPPMDSKGIFHLNPHIFGIDGMTGASASSLCQIFAVCIDDSNWEFLPVAFAGIVGDRQHVRGMKGINEYLLKVGCDKKIVEIRQGSVIQDGKIRDAIYYSVDPYFKGLSGNEDAVRQFLAFAGINPETLVQELNENDRRKLVSLLALRLLGQGCTLDTLEEVTQERIYFAEWKLYASELASILNACGRTGNESVGLGVTLRDEKSIVKATELRKIYKESILSSLRALESDGVRKLNNIQYFFTDDSNTAGTICGLVMQYLADRDKPTIAISKGNHESRISSRATFVLLSKGVDLSEALKESAMAVGGTGGGHAIASGATIPRGTEEKFLEILDATIAKQKNASA